MQAATDPELLYQVFRHSYSPQNEERKQAEAWLQQAEGSRGLLPALLQIATAEQAEKPIRQAAAIQLKNQIRRRWSPAGGDDSSQQCYSEEDKASVRAQLVDSVARSGSAPEVRSQLVECFRLAALNDFPEGWPGLVERLAAGLRSDDTVHTHSALLLLRKLFKQLERRPAERRGDMESLCAQTLPTLQTLTPALAQVATQRGPHSLEAFEMLKLVLKCFHSAIYMYVGNHVQKDMDAWMRIVLGVVDLPMGPPVAPQDLQAREAAQDAKCRKWAFHILFRFYHKHGHSRRAVDGMEEFAEAWSDKYEVPVAEACLKEVCAQQRGTWAPRRSLSTALLCLGDACSREAAYQALKPGMHHLLQLGIFPQVRFRERDSLLWQEDPEEYIREMMNDFDSDSNPRAAAVEVVERLLLFRRKDALVPLLQFCQQHLEAHLQNPSDPELCANKYGALLLLGTMAEQLTDLDPAQQSEMGGKARKKKTKSKSKSKSANGVSIEELLERHVRPSLTAPAAFLRLRACWVYQQIASKAPRLGPPGSAATACRECLRLAADAELPVRVVAATCLQAFLEREDDEEVRAVVVENLAAVLEQLLRVLAEVQCEEVAEALQMLIESFPSEIVPFAARLVAQLANQFCQMTAASKDDDDAEAAAMGSAATIISVLQACSSLQNPEDPAEQQRRAVLFASLAESVCPLVARLLQPEGIDYMEEGLEMLSYLTGYCSSPIPAPIWALLPRLFQAVCGKATASLPLPDVLKDGWAPDFMTSIAEPMLNYMSRGPPEVFLAGTWAEGGMSYADMVFDMFRKLVHTPGIGSEKDGASAVSLGAALFEYNTAPGVDQWLPRYFSELWTRLPSAETSDLRRGILLTFATMIWYNAELFLRCAEEKGCTLKIFEVWMQKISIIRRLRHRQVMLLGKVRLLQLGCSQALPQSVANGLPSLVRMLGLQTKEIIRLRQKQASEDDDDDDDESSDEEGGAARDARVSKVLGKLETAEDHEDNSEDGEDSEDEDFLDWMGTGSGSGGASLEGQRPSPLSRLDELSVLQQTLQQAPTAMQQQMESWLGGGLAQWISELSTEVSRKASAKA